MNSPLKSTEKNLYIDADPFVYWFKLIFGLVSSSLVFISLVLFLTIDAVIFAVYFIPILVFFAMNFTLFYTSMRYKKFDLEKHNTKVNEFISVDQKPSVDIFLPIAGEGWSVLERTWNHVKNLDYDNFDVLVLDDKNEPEIKAHAEKYGFRYYSRPDRGVNKKAGNLKYGLTKSTADFFVILDADFAPNPEFLNNLLPYFKDERVGIVQSPQFFNLKDEDITKNDLQYDAGFVQEDFYAYIQVARDGVNATVCVGSNAIYSRKYLNKIGGVAQIDHSEDIYTGIKVQEDGGIVKYVPMNLASGECPDDLQSYFSQQQRWCRGNLDLISDPDFWRKKLNFKQKCAYLNGYFYYIFTFFEKMLWTIPFVLVIFYRDLIAFENILLFVPGLIFSAFVTRFTRRYPRRFLSANEGSNGMIYCWTFITSLFSSDFKWIASGKARNNLKPDYKMFLIFLNTFSFIWCALSAFSLFVVANNISSFIDFIDFTPVIYSILLQTTLIISVLFKHNIYVLDKLYSISPTKILFWIKSRIFSFGFGSYNNLVPRFNTYDKYNRVYHKNKPGIKFED